MSPEETKISCFILPFVIDIDCCFKNYSVLHSFWDSRPLLISSLPFIIHFQLLGHFLSFFKYLSELSFLLVYFLRVAGRTHIGFLPGTVIFFDSSYAVLGATFTLLKKVIRLLYCMSQTLYCIESKAKKL